MQILEYPTEEEEKTGKSDNIASSLPCACVACGIITHTGKNVGPLHKTSSCTTLGTIRALFHALTHTPIPKQPHLIVESLNFNSFVKFIN